MAAFRDSISAWVIHTLLVDCRDRKDGVRTNRSDANVRTHFYGIKHLKPNGWRQSNKHQVIKNHLKQQKPSLEFDQSANMEG